jgi:hypothetical protein
VTCAPGIPPNRRAQAATAQAPQPLSCAIAAATGGPTGATMAVRRARPSTSTTIGTATTFAGTVTSEIWWNWNHVTGAVARPHAVETPISCASSRETGYPSSVRTTRGVTTKIEATAANESWNPASNSVYGFQPSRRAAPTSKACHRSRSRATSQASDPSPAASAARTTDGWSATASA